MNNEEKIVSLLETLVSKVDKLEQGQAETNVRLNKLEQGQAETNARLDKLEQRQSNLEQRQFNLEQRQSRMEQNQEEMYESIHTLNQRVATVEHKVLKELGIIKDGISGWKERNEQIDEIEAVQENHEDRIFALEQIVSK